MSHLDKAFKNTQEERYLLADLILRKLNDKKLLQILNMGHKTSDREALKELISMSTHPYLTWFLSSKLSMITGVPRNKMSATMMYNPTKGRNMRHMRRNPDKPENKIEGESSRGGKVIGHTSSGKPVYETPNHHGHSTFTSEDHKDAAKAHIKIRKRMMQEFLNADFDRESPSFSEYHKRLANHMSAQKLHEGKAKEIQASEGEENMRRNPSCMRRNPVRLHSTYQPDIYYTNFQNLPVEAQKILLDTPVEVERSSYTVYESTAFIRNTISFDDRYFEAEITLGSVDIKHSDYKYDDELNEYVDDEGRVIDSENYANLMVEELLEYIEIENLNVYLTEIDPPRIKRNPSHEEHRDTMKKLYEMARASARGTLDVRLLDIAHGAVRIDELDHVLEQCDDKKVCDYAAYKKAFFIDKKMTKNNPMSRKGIRDIKGIKKPSDGMLHSKNRSGDGRFTGLNSILGLSDSEIRKILKKELNERFFATTKIGAIDDIKEVQPIGFRKERSLAIEVKGTLKKLYVEVNLDSALVRIFNYSVKSKNPESGTVEAEVFYDLEDINELLEEIHKMCLMSHSGTVFRSKPNF